MAADYLAYLVLALIAIGITSAFILIGIFVGPKSESSVKQMPFETGLDYLESAKQVNVKFYLVAMIFLLFDVEVALLYPYALVVKQLGIEGFIAVFIFLMLLMVGIIYEYKRKILTF